MNKNAVNNIKQQVEQAEAEAAKKPGFLRRAWNWVKGIVTKGAKAVGRIIPERAKKFVVSVAQKVSNAVSYAYDYVMPPLDRILNRAAIITACIWLALAAVVLPVVFLAVVGSGTLLFIAYAYLYAARERRIPGAILKGSIALAGGLWTAFKAAVLVLGFMGGWATSLGLFLLISLAVVLNNATGQNERLEHRKIVEEARSIVEDPSMPAVAVS